MISAKIFAGDPLIWLVVLLGPLVGYLLFRLTRRPVARTAQAVAPVDAIHPSPLEPDHRPVPNQRGGIPSTALVRIHDACNGMIKDGELDIRFELRSRRDCDKMLEVMRGMKESLERTRTVFGSAEAEIRSQLDAPAVKNSGRVGIFGRGTANAEDFISAKHAELDGYELATRLVDKFIFELGGAELSVRQLPFYAEPSPAPVQSLRSR